MFHLYRVTNELSSVTLAKDNFKRYKRETSCILRHKLHFHPFALSFAPTQLAYVSVAHSPSVFAHIGEEADKS